MSCASALTPPRPTWRTCWPRTAGGIAPKPPVTLCANSYLSPFASGGHCRRERIINSANGKTLLARGSLLLRTFRSAQEYGMTPLEIKTTSGPDATIDQTAVSELRTRLGDRL